MTRTSQPDTSQLAIRGGAPCVCDPPASYLHGPQEIGQDEIQAVVAALESQNLFRFFKDEQHSPTAQFEKLFAQMTNTKHALAVNSGTSALICGMIGLGVSSGDEVIVPAYTYIASAAAVLAVGAIPVIAEVDNSLTLDPCDVEKKITSRTTLILPVHMRGVPCRMDKLLSIARARKTAILEDCAQSNGGSFRGKPLGSLGKAGAFSFQHFKIITAGEGGALVTNERETFERAACYHDSAYAFWKSGEGYEWLIKPFLGENFRMSDLNGALALAQLKKRDGILRRLRAIKNRVWNEIADLSSIEFQDIPDREGDCATSLVLFLETPERACDYAAALRAEGMQAGSMFDKGFPDRHIYFHWEYILQKRTPHRTGYPWNNPAQPCQVEYAPDMCPQTLGYLNRAVAIPFTQTMSDLHVEGIIRAIRKVNALL